MRNIARFENTAINDSELIVIYLFIIVIILLLHQYFIWCDITLIFHYKYDRLFKILESIIGL